MGGLSSGTVFIEIINFDDQTTAQYALVNTWIKFTLHFEDNPVAK